MWPSRRSPGEESWLVELTGQRIELGFKPLDADDGVFDRLSVVWVQALEACLNRWLGRVGGLAGACRKTGELRHLRVELGKPCP